MQTDFMQKWCNDPVQKDSPCLQKDCGPMQSWFMQTDCSGQVAPRFRKADHRTDCCMLTTCVMWPLTPLLGLTLKEADKSSHRKEQNALMIIKLTYWCKYHHHSDNHNVMNCLSVFNISYVFSLHSLHYHFCWSLLSTSTGALFLYCYRCSPSLSV